MTRTTLGRSWFAWIAFALAGFALGLACRTALRDPSTPKGSSMPAQAEKAR